MTDLVSLLHASILRRPRSCQVSSAGYNAVARVLNSNEQDDPTVEPLSEGNSLPPQRWMWCFHAASIFVNPSVFGMATSPADASKGNIAEKSGAFQSGLKRLSGNQTLVTALLKYVLISGRVLPDLQPFVNVK